MDAYDCLAQELDDTCTYPMEGSILDGALDRDKAAALLRTRIGPLMEEFKAFPEWVEEDGWLVCPRCLSFKQWGHAPDCPRQLALAAFENVTPEKP